MIELYAANTPNGQKPIIFLEEAGLPYELTMINLGAGEQKQPWFLEMNPNGRIPVIRDRANDDFVVFESGAILLYLANRAQQFLPEDEKKRSQVIQWLMFQMGGVGPMMGQASVFLHSAPEEIDYAIERYQNETRRLFEVLERQLSGRDYLVDEYSIADIATWSWVKIHGSIGVSTKGLPALDAWIKRIAERPAVINALAQLKSA